jgi:hypothetical protein
VSLFTVGLYCRLSYCTISNNLTCVLLFHPQRIRKLLFLHLSDRRLAEHGLLQRIHQDDARGAKASVEGNSSRGRSIRRGGIDEGVVRSLFWLHPFLRGAKERAGLFTRSIIGGPSSMSIDLLRPTQTYTNHSAIYVKITAITRYIICHRYYSKVQKESTTVTLLKTCSL